MYDAVLDFVLVFVFNGLLYTQPFDTFAECHQDSLYYQNVYKVEAGCQPVKEGMNVEVRLK